MSNTIATNTSLKCLRGAVLALVLSMGSANAAIVVSATNDANLLSAALTAGGDSGITVTSAIVSTPNSAGRFGTGTFALTGPFPDTYGLTRPGIVMTTGSAAAISSVPSTEALLDFVHGLASTPAQEALLLPLASGTKFDVSQLDLTFDAGPGTSALIFRVIFGSEESDNFLPAYNDAFGLFVNGVNVALAQGSPLNANHPTRTPTVGTQVNRVVIDGGQALLTFTVPVVPGSIGNTVTMIIGDTRDASFDSLAFVSSVEGVVVEPGFACSDLTAMVGVWGITSGRCGNFVSNATTARYESAMYEFAAAQLRGSLPGEYVYEVELLANRPRQPSAASSLLVAGSPLPLQTATRNWNRAIAFNISHNGRYSIFSYNGPGLPVALQRWVTPVGVAINRAPLSNTLTVARVQNNVRAPGINAVSSHNLLFSINDVLVRSLPDTYGVDQFGVGFVRSVVTNGDLMSDDWLEVLGVTLNNPVPTATGQLDQQVSRAQQDANDAANARRDNADPLFAPKEGR